MKIRPTTILAVIVFLLGIMFDLNYAKYFIVLGMLVYFSVYRSEERRVGKECR